MPKWNVLRLSFVPEKTTLYSMFLRSYSTFGKKERV